MLIGEEEAEQRQPIQRDWLGHLIQAVGIVLGMFVTIGLPLVIWGSGVNSTLATLAQRIDRQEHDLSDQRQTQVLVTGQILDVNKQLTRIDTQLGDIREKLAPKR